LVLPPEACNRVVTTRRARQRAAATQAKKRDRSLEAAGARPSSRQIIQTFPCGQSIAGKGPPAVAPRRNEQKKWKEPKESLDDSSDTYYALGESR